MAQNYSILSCALEFCFCFSSFTTTTLAHILTSILSFNCNYEIYPVGDSAVCSFLSWRLAVGGCDVVLANSIIFEKLDGKVYWSSQKYTEKEYKPYKVYNTCSDIEECERSLDFVLLSSPSLTELHETMENLKVLTSESTIILVDSSACLKLEIIVQKYLPENLVLALTSDVTVKILKHVDKYEYSHMGTKVATLIGSTISNPSTLVRNSLAGTTELGKKLYGIQNILQSNGVFPCNVVQTNVRPTINSSLWKQTLIYLSFSVLSLLYGELDLSIRLQNSIVKNIFNDILQLAYKDCSSEFPDPSNIPKANLLFDQLVTQYNEQHSRYRIKSSAGCGSNRENCILEMPVVLYNFSTDFQNNTSLCFTQLLSVAQAFQITIAYVECSCAFYTQVEQIGKQRVFDWIKRCSFQEEHPLTFQGPSLDYGYNIAITSDQLFGENYNGASTPTTPLSNTCPPGFTSYPEKGVLLPQGVTPNVYHQQYPYLPQAHPPPPPPPANKNRFKTSFQLHPRFKDVPKDEVNGKKISYHQMKNMIYHRTNESTAPESLTQAQKHIYQYANLNGTFESVNNRYGWSDSLAVFKLSSGFKDSQVTDKTENGSNSIRVENTPKDNLTTFANVQETYVESTHGISSSSNEHEDSSDNDMETADSTQKIN
jgi:hypothetical protein